ncbi:MAG: hypothetical protein GC181_03590 [Bacteroidetes bacterium]|nr:hypothetical protein [Bacteroidota bacterium]
MKKLLYRLVTGLNRRTSYPMLVTDWKKFNSSSVLAEVMNSGYFKQTVRPVEPELSNFKNVLVIAPHQDDEAIGCGGLLIKMKNQWNSTVLFVTDGFQTNFLKRYPDIINVRKEEAKQALKFANSDVVFADLPNEELNVSDSESIQKLAGIIKGKNPDLILTTWFLDRPEKHRACTILLYEALKKAGLSSELPIWSYQVHNVLFPNVAVDISNVVDDKISMIRCYKSQIEGGTAYDRYIIGMNQWNAQYHPTKKDGYTELFFALPNKDWQKLISKLILSDVKKYLNFE